jgi:hypothetical protein
MKTSESQPPHGDFDHTVGELTLSAKPHGPTQEQLNELGSRLLQHASLKDILANARHALLSIGLLEPESVEKSARAVAPDSFLAVIQDYTNHRTLRVTGSISNSESVAVEETSNPPLPSENEFREAIEVVHADPYFKSLREQFTPYPAMPYLSTNDLADGSRERVIAIGLLPRNPQFRHEIVGVNLDERRVIRYEGNAPASGRADGSTCGVALDAGQATVSNAAGQVWITVTQGSKTLWRFLAVRPAASSGTRGSGIELRYLDYKGKRLLYRAHVPILNVRYDNDACGPYRDWQNQEGMLQAAGTDVAPGFRLCNAPAKTILESGSDTGNYLGVAIYVQGLEVVLVSEMQAGWYRYVSEWRLHVDGTIRPRFGFSAVKNSCVCNRHHHHAYWRFDFDIDTPGNNQVREFNDPPIFPGTNWHDKKFEIKRFRDPSRKRRWQVLNTASGDAYDIIPGPNDSVATQSPDWPFPQGDVWVLKYRGTELDDGVNQTGGAAGTLEAHLDNFVNGESVQNTDVVVWYAGHVTHDVNHDPPGVFGHITGPDLKPVKW